MDSYNIAAKVAQLPADLPAVALPEAPRWSSTVTVANASGLSAALATGARRVQCVPGSVFNQVVTVSQPDTLLDMTGCRVDPGTGARALNVSANRVRVQGGTWIGGFSIERRTDVHLYGVDFTGLAQGALNEIMYANRVVIERSSIRQNVPAPSAVVIWAQQSNDLVLANSQFLQLVGGQATIRTHGSKVVVMDNFIANPTHHTLRAHRDGTLPSPFVYWGRNLTQGGAVQAWAPGSLEVDKLWVVDNDFHFNATSFFIEPPSVTTAVTTGNRVYAHDGSFTWQAYAGWVVSGNTSFAYQPSGLWNGTGAAQ